jgi:lysozyme family protein
MAQGEEEMADFNKAIITVLKHEGGFCNDPDDPGGATSYGISLRFLLKRGSLKLGDIDGDGDIDIDDIREMSLEDAKNIYYKEWWQKYRYGQIDHQELATKIFDFSVNMGSRQAHKLLQRALRACGMPVKDDGILGARSRAAIRLVTESGRGDALLCALRSEAAGFYRLLAATKRKLAKFLNGWLSRAYS